MDARGPPAERDAATVLGFGVVPLDKPPGPTAHQVSDWCRTMVADALTAAGATPIERAAHAGTLDPKVTGCLPVLLGDATRLAGTLAGSSKEYVAVLELHGPAPDDLEETVSTFEGPILQKPPRKSAVARRRRVRTVHALDVLEVSGRRALLRVRCEAGTYVRKLCHDLGLALGTGGHMGDLRRVASGPFDDSDLVSMHDLADALACWQSGDPSPLRRAVRPGERAIQDLPGLRIAPSAASEVATGAPVYAPGVIDSDVAFQPDREQRVACYTPDGAVVCLGRLVGDPAAESGEVVALDRVLV